MKEERKSEEFRNVIDDAIKTILALIEEGRKKGEEEKEPFIVAIDGRCASGKTTLGKKLAVCLEGSLLVHMDDYYLQKHQRTPERYQTPGENIDHERFLEQVLIPATTGERIVLQKLSCPDLLLQKAESAEVPEVLIVEGSYSFHPDLRPYYDLKIFVSTTPKRQKERILTRNGPQKAEDFRNRWIPLEEKYIAAAHPEKQAHLRIDT